MSSIVKNLIKKQMITPPHYLMDGLQYEVMMGSVAYGVSDNTSDVDIYGFTIPPKDMVFPHLRGEILGFGNQIKRFEQYQQHHIVDITKDKEYDLQIYSIIKYFQLCMENNPNMIDSLFVPQRCVLYQTKIGNIIRENRKIFLHKGSWHKFKGYAFSQMKKMRTKNPEGKRKEIIEQFGFDVKFAYHIVRLLNEVEQIMIECDLDLERNREQLKSIRRGDWSITQIENYFDQKERELEGVYSSSKLPHRPNEIKIKQILLNCLEEYYGSLDNCIIKESTVELLINDLKDLISKHNIKKQLG